MGSDILCYPLCYFTSFIHVSHLAHLQDRLSKLTCPIFKKGDTMDVVNYRPVSILPSASKVFEKEMVYRMSKYFEDLFNPYVSGFRKNHSCINTNDRNY